MTKEEKIKEAYGADYDKLRDFIDENGWYQKRIFNVGDMDRSKYDYKATSHGIYISRPKELKGLENNNGWIKIENKPNMEEKSGFLLFIFTEKGNMYEYNNNALNLIVMGFEKITHYKYFPISEKPVY